MGIALVLGAGASLANALHFRTRKMPQSRPPLDTTFFGTVRARGMPLSVHLRRYFIDVLGIDPDSDALNSLRMEEVFKDVFFDFQDAPTNTPALNAYIDLVDLYLAVLRVTTNWLNGANRAGAPIGRLLADAAGQTDDLSVVTFNHDLVIENEIERRANLRSRWCIDRGYGTVGEAMNPLVPSGGNAAVFRRHVDGQCHHTRAIRILKLHGSLNWVVRIAGDRPTASFLNGSNNARTTHLVVRRQIFVGQRYIRAGRGRTQWHMWPVVVPPVYAKQALRAALHATWDDARTAIQDAERLVFFGYSLPLIDIEAEKLFQRALAHNNAIRWLDVVNPDPQAAARYASVARDLPVRWYPDLNSFLSAGGCG